MDDVVDIMHAELLEADLTGTDWRWWRLVLSRQAVSVYQDLRRRNGHVLDARLWARELGMSRHGIDRALRELHRHGFVDLPDADQM